MLAELERLKSSEGRARRRDAASTASMLMNAHMAQNTIFSLAKSASFANLSLSCLCVCLTLQLQLGLRSAQPIQRQYSAGKLTSQHALRLLPAWI